MRDDLRDILDKNRHWLVRGLDIEHGLLNRLLSTKVINDDHLEDIQSMRTSRQKVETLLDILKKQDDNTYTLLRELVATTQPQLVSEYLPTIPWQETELNQK